MTTALTNLYVRNIPLDWTAQELIALGDRFGPIVSARILYNPLTTASRGMGFIRYAEHADATLAIAGMNGHIPESGAAGAHHKPLNVQFAKDQQVGNRSGGGRGGDGSTDGAASGAGGGSARYAPYAPHAVRQRLQPSADGFVEELPVAPDGTDPLNVYVVDLPLSCTKDDFHALYEPFGQLVTSTVLLDPATGVSRGIGFARFSSRENAARALKETQGLMLPNASKPLLVRFARDSSRKYDEQTQQSLASLSHYAAQQQQQAAAAYASPYYAQPASYIAYYSQPAFAELKQPYPAAAAQLSPSSISGASTASPASLSASASSSSASSVASSSSSSASASFSSCLSSSPASADSSAAAAAAAYQAWAAYYSYYYPQHPLPPPPPLCAQPTQPTAVNPYAAYSPSQQPQQHPSLPSAASLPLPSPLAPPAAPAAGEMMRGSEPRSVQQADRPAASSVQSPAGGERVPVPLVPELRVRPR